MLSEFQATHISAPPPSSYMTLVPIPLEPTHNTRAQYYRKTTLTMESSPEMQALIRLTPEERTLMRTPGKRLNIARKKPEEEPPKPLDDFFTQGYPQFNFVASASPESQWKRLALSEQWSPGSHDYISARARFEAAYDDQFNTAIDGFFNDFLDFDYNPRAEAKAEFERLRQSKRWFDDGQKPLDRWYKWVEYRRARVEFFDAFRDDFSCFFGSGDDVRDWVFLCDVLRVKPTPRTIEHCKTVYTPPLIPL